MKLKYKIYRRISRDDCKKNLTRARQVEFINVNEFNKNKIDHFNSGIKIFSIYITIYKI